MNNKASTIWLLMINPLANIFLKNCHYFYHYSYRNKMYMYASILYMYVLYVMYSCVLYTKYTLSIYIQVIYR